MQVALHTGDLHEHALVRDLERCLVDELIGVVDADRTQPPDIGVGDASQILEGPVHMYRILVGGSPHPAARFARSRPPHRWGGDLVLDLPTRPRASRAAYVPTGGEVTYLI